MKPPRYIVRPYHEYVNLHTGERAREVTDWDVIDTKHGYCIGSHPTKELAEADAQALNDAMAGEGEP